MADIQETLDWHAEMNLRPVPLIGKRPFLRDFGLEHRRALTAEDFVNPWGRPHNIGWQLGPPSGGLCDLDMDTDDEDSIRAALDIYEGIRPFVFGKTADTPSHIMFRVSEHPEDWRAARITVRPQNDPDKAFEFRTGGFNGREENGIPLVHQIQTFTIGRHPATKRPLEWHRPLNSPEDIPTIEWEHAETLFLELCDTLKLGCTPRQ